MLPMSTPAMMTGASPLTLKPYPSCSRFLILTFLGAVQWCLAEKIATGPKLENKSCTLCCPRSGKAKDSWYCDEGTIEGGSSTSYYQRDKKQAWLWRNWDFLSLYLPESHLPRQWRHICSKNGREQVSTRLARRLFCVAPCTFDSLAWPPHAVARPHANELYLKWPKITLKITNFTTNFNTNLFTPILHLFIR